MDFVVVGGGVVGCGVAWELAKRGAEVCLVEANTIASGASGGLGKRGVRANGRDLRELPLMRIAYDLWPTLEEQIGTATGYERVGSLHLIEHEGDYHSAPARAWAQNQKGIPTRLIERDELRALEPYLGEQIIAALHCPKDGVSDHTATTRGLAQAAQRLGATIREHARVVSLERHGDRITALITDEEERIAVDRYLFLLSNTDVFAFLQEHFGVTLPVWRFLPQVMLTEPVEPMPLHHLIGHANRRLAMKATPDGRVMISGGWSGQWNQQTSQGEVRDDQVRGNLAEAVAVYPCLEGVGIAATAADRPESNAADNIPIIDLVPGVSNALFATGWSGHGWAIAPAVNQLLALWTLQGEQQVLLHPFSYSRFFK